MGDRLSEKEYIQQFANILLNEDSFHSQQLGNYINRYVEIANNPTIYQLQNYLKDYVRRIIDIIIELKRNEMSN